MFIATALVLNALGVWAPDQLTSDITMVRQLQAQTVSIPARHMTIEEFLGLASAQFDTPITGDWAALDAVAISREDEVDIGCKGATVLGALDSVAQLCGEPIERPRLEVFGGRVILTTDAGMKSMRATRIYPAGEMAKEWLEMIMNHVDPEGWVDSGGVRASAEVRDGSLVVTASTRAHAEIESLIASWRHSHPLAVRVSLAIARADAGSAAPGASAPLAAFTQPPWTVLYSPCMIAAMNDSSAIVVEDGRSGLTLELTPSLAGDGSGISVKISLVMHDDGLKANSSQVLHAPFDGGTTVSTLPTREGLLLLRWEVTPVSDAPAPAAAPVK
ncbi:MAG: hypothetical protein EXS00_06855 [Phycisphaerales bacterium]|nr:hypothetical protein [Phycisphaerales bacterium]